MPIRFIYFDCMDTLIQVKMPSLDLYAAWAYEGAARLGFWRGGADFRADWDRFRERFFLEHGWLREGTVQWRIREILRARQAINGLEWAESRIEEEAARIHGVYWENYRSATFVLPEVPEALDWIAAQVGVPCGVVSNFMVPGGIPELLARHRLDRFFGRVLVSCDLGWRKPAEFIYREAIRAAGCPAEEILFIGDNPIADYEGPRIFGMAAALYDPEGRHPEIASRIASFLDLKRLLAAGGGRHT